MATVSPQDSWFDEIWPRVVKATGVGYLVTAYAVSHWLTRRSPAKVEWPRHLGPMEPLKTRTSDGVPLKGWLIEPAHPRATVALFHGLRGNRLDSIERIKFLSAAGYRCVTFDLRAHGESGGRWTSFGYHERRDVIAVCDLIHARWPHQPCAVVGTSMGGAAVCFAGAKVRCDAIVLESVYHDLSAAFESRVGCGFPSWFKHFRPCIEWLTERRFGVEVNQVSPVAHIANLAPRPILLLTGSEDPHAPPHEMQLLADRVPGCGRLHIIPGAGHENICEGGGKAYQALVLSFLDRQLFALRQPQAA